MSDVKHVVVTREGLQRMKEELEYKETTEKMKVAEQLKAQHGVAVDKRDIKCENIRAVGDVEIEVRLYKDISAKMVVHVEAAAVK